MNTASGFGPRPLASSPEKTKGSKGEDLVVRLRELRSRLALAGSLLLAVLVWDTALPVIATDPAPSGQAVIVWHVTISPSWFDPSTAPPQITPFGMLYAIHDALVRPYPGQKLGPRLA